ncbi:PaaD-like protein (DUF59) involved in Fe-S cluster assembly [invertebrate metagenome]|uniref:PaaD-like protein (DUF59) involved in Fe-S cluster assembly n=1 Tax=invertebrate metagenome TaxID=1711999 RepID=A0A484HD08_9ZZZZ
MEKPHTAMTSSAATALVERQDAAAHAGAPLPVGTPVAMAEAVTEALQKVFDPEIPVNIYDLGLVYDLCIADDGWTAIWMTLTAPSCPVAGVLPAQVACAAAAVPGVGEVDVFLVWDPPWTPERMSEVARITLDMF